MIRRIERIRRIFYVWICTIVIFEGLHHFSLRLRSFRAMRMEQIAILKQPMIKS